MNIWTVDKATIRTEIKQRNALRKTACLSLLDEQKEFDAACRLIRSQRWHAFKEGKQADYERFREEVYIIHNQFLHSSSKEKPARAGGHLAGFSTGVLAQSGMGLIADPIVTSPLPPFPA
jgi:hypothetical protein